MQIPAIRIASQMGKIAIEQSQGKQHIAQPKADMSISQPKAAMSINATKGVLTIDQSQAWEEANLIGPLRLTEKTAQAGKQAALQATQKRAAQGSQLIDIHLGANAIVEQAKQNGHPQYMSPTIKYIPSPLAVKTHYEKGKVLIDVQAREPNIDVRVNKPAMNYQRGAVHISMAQDPSLSIHFEHIDG